MTPIPNGFPPYKCHSFASPCPSKCPPARALWAQMAAACHWQSWACAVDIHHPSAGCHTEAITDGRRKPPRCATPGRGGASAEHPNVPPRYRSPEQHRCKANPGHVWWTLATRTRLSALELPPLRRLWPGPRPRKEWCHCAIYLPCVCVVPPHFSHEAKSHSYATHSLSVNI